MNSEEFTALNPVLHVSVARRVVEQDHGLSWFQFAVEDHPDAINHTGVFDTVNTSTLFNWLGY